jgi:hypothetical protein
MECFETKINGMKQMVKIKKILWSEGVSRIDTCILSTIKTLKAHVSRQQIGTNRGLDHPAPS